MFLKLTGALIRAVLVMLLIATPSLLLPGVSSATSEVVSAVALICAGMTFFEYSARVPSLVEFRYAPPFNRIRFLALFANVFLLTLLCRHAVLPSDSGALIASAGTLVGEIIDFPLSPVRLIGLMLPPGASYELVGLLRAAAGLSYLSYLVMIAFFAIMLQVQNWPASKGAFNVWVNMPNFDPTVGGDVVDHLVRDSRINVLLGLALPFVTPLFVMMAADLFDPDALGNYQTLIWMVAIWAFIPAGLLMRGIALGRIAHMLQRKRLHALESQPLLSV